MPQRVMTGLGAMAALGLLAACQGGQIQGAGNPLESGRPLFLADQSDPCFPERQEMERYGEEVKSTFDTLLDAGFAVGGVLESLRQTGRVGGTFGSGGVTVSGGYIEALRNESGTILDLVRNAARDVDVENQRIDALLAAFDTLTACRKAGAAAIRSDYQARKIDRATAEAAMGALRSAYAEDIARFREISAEVAKNTDTFAEVYNDIAADNDGDALVVGPYRKEVFETGKPTAKVVKRRPQKRVSKKGSLKVEAPAPQAKPEVDNLQEKLLTNVRKRDEVINRVETASDDVDGLGDLDLASLTGPRGTG
ncbi:MAG: hypothetical protein AAFV19_20080 [Pseudomonadota bacterium]